jgi:dienelactone hydrolase
MQVRSQPAATVPVSSLAPTAAPPMRAAARWLAGLLALLAIGAAVWHLEQAADGLVITTERLGTTPVTVFRPAGAAAAAGVAPVVLIAHGFAGSQQLMQPFALTLARNGFVAVTFDFPGHGRNSAPMRGGLVDLNASQRSLLASMQEMGAFARRLAGSDGRYAVVGHSMASDIVVQHAQAHAEVQASVGVSLFAPSITAGTPADSPRNLLVIAGALEPAMMADEALRVVGLVAGPAAAPHTTYGRFEDGTARRATLSPGVEHIGVLYSASTLGEMLAWLNQAFDRPPARQAFIDMRGPWLGLLLAGVVVLAWPLSALLPRLGSVAHASGERLRWWAWRGQAPLTLLPALLTPLLLWKLPSSFLPILLGDYLVLHFGLYGLLTFAGLALARRPLPHLAGGHALALSLAMLLATAYALFAVGLPVDRYVFNVHPEPGRLPVILAMCAGTLPYFLADEWLARGAGAARGASFVSKLCFLLSLLLAIALNPQRLFFLAIIVPAILLLFIVYGLFNRWAERRTGHPAPAAVANALAFGCFIAVTFPLVA